MSYTYHPRVEASVELIVVNRTETLTVYLRTSKFNEPLQQLQIELRVTGDGIPEIFCDSSIIKKWDEWKPITGVKIV